MHVIHLRKGQYVLSAKGETPTHMIHDLKDKLIKTMPATDGILLGDLERHLKSYGPLTLAVLAGWRVIHHAIDD